MKLAKILSIFVICAMCLSLCTVSYAKSITEDSELVSDIELLQMLGIFTGYEDGNLHPDWSITRMEFAAIINRVLGYDNGIGQMETPFSDVPATLWGSGYIKMAYDLGIVSGYTDGTFRPDNKITESECIKMIVSALGYSYWAEQNGGYPQGYISMGSRLDILDRAVDSKKEATRGYVAAILANALETKIVHPEEENVAEYDDNILLRLGISVRKGILSAIYGASLSEDVKLEENQIIVSGERYETNLVISSEYIGANVKIYIKDYGRSDELVVGIIGDKADTSLTVMAEDILDSTTLSQLVYTSDNGKRRTEALEANIKISYNGKMIDNSADYTAARLMPEGGYVKLMDTDKNGRYDSAVVKEYKTFVVRGVSQRIITDAYGGRISFDEETIMTITMDNTVCTLEDIKANDVLSVASSLDGEIIDIVICRDTIEGVVEAFESGEDKNYYTLDDGEEYSLSASYVRALEGGYSTAEKIELGTNMKFYLNNFGEVAMAEKAEETEREMLYGYLTDAELNSGLKNKASFKILGHENRFIYLNTIDSNKILFGRMEGETYVKSKVGAETIFNVVAPGGKVEKQMIAYVLDEEGKIKEFHLRDVEEFSDNFSRDVQRGSKVVRYHTIDGKYYWDDNTVCFYIPSNGTNPAAFSSGRCVEYFEGEDSLTMELWDIDSDGYINCIYCSDTSTGRELSSGSIYFIDYVNSPIMFITKVYHETNDEGVEYKVIEGWQNKKLTRTLVSDTLSKKSSDLRPGVVIQYTTDETKQMFAETSEDDVVMVVYAVLFDMNNYNAEQFMSYDYAGTPYTTSRIQFGYTDIARLDYPLIKFGHHDDIFEVHNGTTVYIYSRGSQTITKGDVTDLAEGSTVFMRTRYRNLREVVIIED